MKKKIIYIFIACLGLVVTSCNDLLDRTSNSQVSEENMWKTENLVEQGMDGVYQTLRKPVWSGSLVGASANIGYYGWETFGMTGQTRLNASGVFSSSVNPNNTHFSAIWKLLFNSIQRANDAIANLPGSGLKSDETKAQYIAEAKTIRAFAYMRANELFGRGIGLPIYTKSTPLTDTNIPQSSEKEVWDLVISDLTDAIETVSLPNMTNSSKVSKGVAYALRGRAYLLRSQSLGENNYDKAVSDFAKAGSFGYSLFMGNYADLFTVANENSKEFLLSVQNIEDPKGYGSQFQKFAAPFQAGSKDSRGCWTDIQVTPAIVDLYEVKVNDSTVKDFNWNDFIVNYNETSYTNRSVYFIRDTKSGGKEILTDITTIVNKSLNALSASVKANYLPEGNEARLLKAYSNRDPRLAASVITPYSTFLGVNNDSSAAGEYVSRWPAYGKSYFNEVPSEASKVPGMKATLVANQNQYFYYLYRKFVGKGLEFSRREDNPIDEPILRYADVLLMWAEALVELNDLSGAKEKVELVRNRVKMPTLAISFADQATARNYVRDERRREFIAEGVNFFDEMRWKTLKETKFNYGPSTAMQVWGGVSTGNVSYAWNDKWYTWPVPTSVIQIDTKLSQTPGWNY